MPARTVRGKGTVPCDLSANTAGSFKLEIGPSNLGGARARLAPPPASAPCTHAPRAQSRRRAILPGFECAVERWLERFPFPFPYYHKVRPGRASSSRVASGNPAGGGMRRSLHFRALESRDRASAREPNLDLCLGQRPRVRFSPSPIGLASSHGVPGLRPKSSSPRASEGRRQPRRGLTRAV